VSWLFNRSTLLEPAASPRTGRRSREARLASSERGRNTLDEIGSGTEERMTRASGGVIAVLLGAAVLAGCSSSPSNQSANTTTSSTAAPTTRPTTAATTATSASAAACTQSAILAAAKSSTSTGPVNSVYSYGCSGGWAYANVNVGSGSASYAAVIVLQAHGSTWVVADRANACSKHLVPSSIYTQACSSS
jgi:hypothetical protein